MALAAAPALIPVTKAVQEAVKPLTADLVVFRGQVFREREETVYGPDLTPKTKALRKHTRKVLEPVDVELHVNALGVGILGAVGVSAGLAAYVAWEGLTLGTPFGPFRVIQGMKETPFWSDLATRWGNRFREAQSKRQAGAIITKFKAGGFPDQQTDPLVFSDDPCIRSKAAFDMETQAPFRAAIKEAARKRGCEWAQ